MSPPLDPVPAASEEPLHHAGTPLQTWEDFEHEAQELWNRGLRGDHLVRALGREDEGPSVVLRTPEDFAAYFESACDPST
jgi:hypothetical protein